MKQAKYLKTDAHIILKQLQGDAPLWVKILRRYIRYLERKACGAK